MVVGELAHERDVMIIGGGPGGYHAAIRAAQLGKRVTLIEKNQLGGVCLNKGCIPTKIFAQAAEKLQTAKGEEDWGIERTEINFNISSLVNYKNKIIHQLRKGVESLCKSNQIELIKGTGYFLSDQKIGVENGEQYEVYKFNQAIIATGAKLTIPEMINNIDERIINPYSLTEMKEIPDELVVMGNDYIALEAATTFQAFGSKVTLLQTGEFPFDLSINRELLRLLKKTRIQVLKDYDISEVSSFRCGVSITLKKGEEKKTITGTHFFYSFGGKPNIEEIGVDRLPIEKTEDGWVKTNRQGQTSISTIYAVGDVTEGPMLAVKAIKQGKVAAEAIAGLSSELDMQFIPSVARTIPPVACVGLTEAEACRLGLDYNASEFLFAANGFSTLIGKKEGLVKVIKEKDTDILLGIHLIGSGAVELITNGVISLEMAARDEDMSFPFYPHPSINEALLEAIEGLKGHSIHQVSRSLKDRVSL